MYLFHIGMYRYTGVSILHVVDVVVDIYGRSHIPGPTLKRATAPCVASMKPPQQHGLLCHVYGDINEAPADRCIIMHVALALAWAVQQHLSFESLALAILFHEVMQGHIDQKTHILDDR